MKHFFLLLVLLCNYAVSEVVNVEDQGPLLVPSQPNRAKERAWRQRMRESVKSTLQDQRIPPTVIPLDYYLRVQPYFPVPGVTMPDGRNMTFDAQLTLSVMVVATTNNFTLDAVNLNIDCANVRITDNNANPVNIAPNGCFYDPNLQHFIIIPNVILIINATYILTFKYTGLINHYDVGGLFYTSYLDQNGAQHFMVATHFETGIHVRAVMPAFDEPSYKAQFHLNLIYPTGMTALSNMLERNPVDLHNGWSMTQFGTTPKMSSYLFAFAVGPFVGKSMTNPAGTIVRSWAWPGMEPYLDFGLNNAAGCLNYFGNYLNFTFPLPKSDQLALPEFPAGAMENWGIVIYKYQYVVFNAQNQPTSAKVLGSEVMCHELAHQWFGDLVTTAWWDDLFLNEGSANYWETIGQEGVYPDQIPFLESVFVSETVFSALRVDGNVGQSHPVVAPNGPFFDTITYSKGASLLRMISNTLGASVMQQGLQQYLKDHQYANANHEDYFRALTTAAQANGLTDWCGRPLNVSLFMDPWVLQQSFPVVFVNNSQLMGGSQLSQQPYNSISTLPPSPYNYTWPIPVFYKSFNSSTSVLRWIPPSYDSGCTLKVKEMPEEKNLHWELDNSEVKAFFRVQYDSVGWGRLMQQLQSNPASLSLQAKMQLMDDSLAFITQQSNNGQPYSYKNFLDVAYLVLPSTANFAPFEVAQSTLDYFARAFQYNLDFPLFQTFMQQIFINYYTALGWSTTSSWDHNIAQNKILPYACRYNVGDCVNQSISLFQNMLQACKGSTNGTDYCNPLLPDIRPAVYCTAIRNGPPSFFGSLLNLFTEQFATNIYFYQEYQQLLNGLSCATDSIDIQNYLSLVLKQPQLVASGALGYLKNNPNAPVIMYQYLILHCNNVFATASNWDPYLDAMTYAWFSQDKVDSMIQLNNTVTNIAFNCTLSTDQLTRLQAYIQRVQTQAQWTNLYAADPIRWLYNNLVPQGKVPWPDRLPTNLAPTSYQLQVQPYFPSSVTYPWYKEYTFDGQVTINFTVLQTTNTIVLNAHRMIIDPNNIVLTSAGTGTQFPINRNQVSKNYQTAFLTIPVVGTLTAGSNYTLTISPYTGFIFSDSSEGVYINTNFFEFNGQKALIFATDFEGGPSTRSIAPCFDEPSYKATWSTTVQHPKDMVALSNGYETSFTFPGGNWQITTFATMPPMSSYLVAIAVGHLTALQQNDQSGTLVRLWSWTGMEQYAVFDLTVASGTLDFMGNYFNFTFPLAKADLLALPQYTGGAGAMENWGLVIGEYQEFLAKTNEASSLELAEIAEVSAHELSHQWFGDLITMKWWDDIFLNEGSAQYWQILSMNASLPTQTNYIYNVDLSFPMNTRRFEITDIGLLVDGRPTTQPVVTNQNPFSGVTYYKGSSLLDMLSYTLGANVFQQGLKLYVQKFAYSNANHDDLWACLTQAAAANGILDWNSTPLNVGNLMNPYILQKTFPVLKVVNENGVIRYYQEPFVARSLLSPSIYNYTWNMPIFTQMSNQPTQYVFDYFTGISSKSTRGVVGTWTVQNAGFRSFMRVWYDDSTWAPILNQLNSDPSVFEVKTRAMFLSDTYALIGRGSLPWPRLLDLTLYLTKETDQAPWNAVRGAFDSLIGNLKYQPEYSMLLTYLRNLTKPAYIQKGWVNGGLWDINILSAQVTSLACQAGYTTCLSAANHYFSLFAAQCSNSVSGTNDCNPLKPDLRRSMYCFGVAQNRSYWDVANNLYNKATKLEFYFTEETDNLLYGMSCSTDQLTLTSMLRYAVGGKYQNPATVLRYIAANDLGPNAMWAYVTTSTAEVVNGVPNFDQFVLPMVSHWNSQAQLARMQGFLSTPQATAAFSANEVAVWNRAIAQVQTNIAWVSNTKPAIAQWLQTNFGS